MKFDVEIWFGDLDAFGHVNNVVYARFLETARVKFFMEKASKIEASFVLRRLEMDFLAPMFLDDVAEVEIWVGEIGTTSWEFLYSIKNKKTGEEVIKARTIQVWVDLESNQKRPIPDELRQILQSEKRG